MRELKDKVVLLTGLGRGVGVGIAKALAHAGAGVGMMGRTRETLEATASLLDQIDARSHICVGDVGVRADIDRTIGEIKDKLGPIWALVNNAYSAMRSKVENITSEETRPPCAPACRRAPYDAGLPSNDEAERGTHCQFRLRFRHPGHARAWLVQHREGSDPPPHQDRRGRVGPLRHNGELSLPRRLLKLLDRGIAPLVHPDRAARPHWDAERDVGALVVFLDAPGGGYITSRTIHIDNGRFHYDR